MDGKRRRAPSTGRFPTPCTGRSTGSTAATRTTCCPPRRSTTRGSRRTPGRLATGSPSVPGVRWDQQTFDGVGAGYTFPGGWAPRLGVTYDPSGKGHSKLYANYGRFYTQYPNDLATRGFSALSATNLADYFDINLTQPIPEGVLAGNTLHHYIISGADPAQAFPDTKNTYNNEYIVGAEYEWLAGLNLSVRYVHRDLQNVLEDLAPAAKVLYDLGLAANIVFAIGNPADGYPATQAVPRRDGERRARDTFRPTCARGVHPQVRRGRVLRRQAAVEQVDAAGVVSLVAAVGRLRRLLSQRQQPVRPRADLTRRPADQRSDLHGNRHAPVRLSRRHPVPGQEGRRTPAQRPHASGEGVRQLRPHRRPEPGRGPSDRLGRTADHVRLEHDPDGSQGVGRADGGRA